MGRWGGVTLTLRHTDPRVKTTGRKSHDPLELRDREREGAGSGEWRDKHGEGGVRGCGGRGELLPDLLSPSLLFFPAGSDAGVCRYAWHLSRCGLQHRRSGEAEPGARRGVAPLFLAAPHNSFQLQQLSCCCCCEELKLPGSK